MKLWKLAYKHFQHELLAQRLNTMIAAVLIAVTCLTMLNFFGNRVQRAFQLQAATLIGADVLIKQLEPIPAKWQKQAETLQLQTTHFVTIPTMANYRDRLQLVSLRAVDRKYPLRGFIQVNDDLDQKAYKIHTIPNTGEIWIDQRLFGLLKVKKNDVIQLGARSFRITKILISQPEVAADWLNTSPAILMSEADLRATKIVVPGSRLQYWLGLIGESDQVRQFDDWLQSQPHRKAEIIWASKGLPRAQSIFTRTENFLRCVLLVCVLLAGVAIAVSALRFAERHQTTVALLRCLGMSQRKIIHFFLWQLGFIGLTASLVGVVLGYYLQNLFVHLFRTWIYFELPSSSILLGLHGIIVGLVMLLTFALPGILQLQAIPPVAILKRVSTKFNIQQIGIGIVLLYVMMFLIIGWTQWPLLVYFMLSVMLSVVLLAGSSYGVIRLIQRIRAPLHRPWKLGLFRIARQPTQSLIPIVAIGLVVMMVHWIIMLRGDLLNDWLRSLPANTPNYFVINLRQQDLKSFEQTLKKIEVKNISFYPIIRGRLIELNRKPILEAVSETARESNALHRDLNLTTLDKYPEDNRIVVGKWWFSTQPHDDNIVSMESGLAKQLGIKLNDELGFQIAEQILRVKVTNLRTVQWESFHPNFYFIFPSHWLEDLPTTFITSFHLEESQRVHLVQLARQFPHTTFFDVHALFKQICGMLRLVVSAMEFLVVLIILASLLVFAALLQNSFETRQREHALLRLLGFKREQLIVFLITEFSVIGAIAAIMGSISAMIGRYIFLHFVFNIQAANSHWHNLIVITLDVVLLMIIVGLIQTRRLIKIAPLHLLR